MTTTRRVHQLRITAPRDDLARRGALLLEDALHTASLPDDGRVLVVRTLRIGTVRVGRAGASIARDVEQSVTQLASRAVHALDASAATADVVYFHDVQESIAELAIRIALQRSTSAWFWRLAVPAWRPSMSRDEALRALVFASLDTPAGRVGPCELVRAIAERDALEPLLGALRSSDGALLLAASGWHAASQGGSEITVSTETLERELPVSARATLQRWAARWGAQDARSAWLACALLVASLPVRAMSDDLPHRARSLVRAVAEGAAQGERDRAPALKQSRAETQRVASPSEEGAASPLATEAGEFIELATLERHAAEAIPDLGVTDVPHEASPNPDDETPESDVAYRDDVATKTSPLSNEDEFDVIDPLPAHRPALERRADPLPKTRPESPVATKTNTPTRNAADFTAFGGLFLLLPVMARLGLPAQLNHDLIEGDFPRRLLHYLAARLGADERDPARLAVAMDEEDNDAWRPELVRWTVRMRSWCRANTGLPMRAIAHRRARIAATRTHVDVHFPLSQVDLRIRRTGLDIDPGWLPWFGRVVRFHYQQERGANGN